MKFPNHIILDIAPNALINNNQYWIFKYIFNFKKSNNFQLLNWNFHKFFLNNKQKLMLNKLTYDQSKFTIQYNISNSLIILNNLEKSFFNKIYNKKNMNNSSFFDFFESNDLYNKTILKKLINNFNFKNSNKHHTTNFLWSLFNINFLRKERIYTKLKYSRVPQYDIVSGGAAALLAGFLGFLITEKFGFELADSGDFYFLFMYLVFLFFIARLFLKIMNNEKTTWNCLSLKWLIFFLKTLIILFFNFIKNIINK